MANRPRGYGLSAELHSKMKAKYEIDKEQEARIWIENMLGEPMVEEADPDEPLGMKAFQDALKDGTILCRVASIVTQNPVKFNKMKVPFKQMENINNFLVACEKYGVNKTDLFQTVDLYENQNMWQVVNTLHSLGRRAQLNGYDGPTLGPKESARNARNFSEDVMKAGQGLIGLQMGTNKCASQKGMSFGATRHIADIKLEEGSREGQGVIGLQMGTNKVASQKGMSFGATRHIADIKVDEGSREGQAVIGLQMGTNKGASQKGMTFGQSRHIVDTKGEQYLRGINTLGT